jgi:putative acetyltransferase
MIIRPARPSDRNALVDVWLRSVRATHTFLTAADIDGLLPATRAYLTSADAELWVVLGPSGEPAGFMGLDGSDLAALFLAPELLRRGVGRRFIDHARTMRGTLTVSVNEQNPAAVRFYEACGFRVVDRSPTDDEGRPFPLLHMRQVDPAYPVASASAELSLSQRR